MHSILGLDVGDKNVGVALGTLKPRNVAPFAIYQRAKGKAESKIIQLVNERQIKEIIAGLPLSENGQMNEQCNKIERFCLRIARRCSVKIMFVDEYATSLEANERVVMLKKACMLQKKKKQNLDAISASIILESYLEYGLRSVIRQIEKKSEEIKIDNY